MSRNDFYQEIEHTPVPWRQHQLHVPLFYREIMLMTVSILAPVERIESDTALREVEVISDNTVA